MSDVDNLDAIEQWAGALLARFTPTQRRQINRTIGLELRRRQSQRIAAQRQPDGTNYIPRKPRKELRQKAGRIKRRKQKMFTKLRTPRYMRVVARENEVSIGFFARIARIARVHQLGLIDRVDKEGPDYKYPARVLIGINHGDREWLRDTLLHHASSLK